MTWLPDVSPALQVFLRVGTGLLTLLTLLMAVPNWRWFFVSEKWGGYAQSERGVNLWQNPVCSALILAAWLTAAACILIDRYTLPAAAVNLLFSHYFFIRMRWKSLLRGMGAPGFLTFWLAAAVLLLEYVSRHAPALRPLAVLVLQVDMAMIMFTAGVSKVNSGYLHGNGMELGMANPMWGYLWKVFRHAPPRHVLFRFQNHLAWSVEIIASLLMLVPVPGIRGLGGFMIAGSFVYVAFNIRLGVLCQMVVLACMVFLPAGSLPDTWLAAVLGSPAGPEVAAPGPVLEAANAALAVFLWAYVILRPLSVLGLFHNFYGKKKFVAPVQKALELWTNAFGIILWRVFTADVTNFFVEIERKGADGQGGRPLARYDRVTDLRFNTVAEAIAVATVFTTLKYFPSNSALFTEKLLRHARTLPCAETETLVYRYVCVVKGARRFDHVPVAEYAVDPRRGTIVETRLSDAVDIRAAAVHSPVHEGATPGSYAPSRS